MATTPAHSITSAAKDTHSVPARDTYVFLDDRNSETEVPGCPGQILLSTTVSQDRLTYSLTEKELDILIDRCIAIDPDWAFHAHVHRRSRYDHRVEAGKWEELWS